MAGGAADIGQVIGDRLLSALEEAEEQLDSEIEKLDRMDEDELETLRRKRLEEMKHITKQKEVWRRQGHGEYDEIDERALMASLKSEARAVVHFFRAWA
jgi:hypothetical protein